MLTLNFGVAFGRNDPGMTYRCTAKDAVGIQDNGTLNKSDPGAGIRRQHFDRMIISVPSGHITYPESTTREERVVQRTSVADDYVLVPSVYFRRKKTAANATTDFVLLHTATGKPQATFIAFQLTYLVTGTCEILK
jgi:hypothetical protein